MENLRNNAKEYAENIKKGEYEHTNADVSVMIKAPVIKIYQNIFDVNSPFLKLDTGTIRVNSDLLKFEKGKDYC